MAPKTLPPQAKQTLVLSYLRSTNTVHTLKDLEKALPSIASINSMQVKDYLQALSDEGQVRVEKIGSGNWYWSFMSEEKKAKELILKSLSDDRQRMDKGMGELRSSIEHAQESVDEGGNEEEREGLIEQHEQQKEEVEALRKELEGYGNGDPTQMLRKRQEVEELKARAQKWTDNIYCIEGYLREITGGDQVALEGIREEYYESEYVAGEGLREL